MDQPQIQIQVQSVVKLNTSGALQRFRASYDG